ncbi:MAG: YlbF family regulator [Bacillota bacterium]|jgi:cell fate (sporulation/competence/biofilm development) regulator YlbF (YheA/YmcA/DUF963 family)
MNAYDHAHALARALRQHPDVVALNEARARLEADPNAKQMFDEFTRKSMQLQLQEMSGKSVSDEERENLDKLAEIVYQHSLIREFQEKAARVERILQDIYGIVGKAIQPED